MAIWATKVLKEESRMAIILHKCGRSEQVATFRALAYCLLTCLIVGWLLVDLDYE